MKMALVKSNIAFGLANWIHFFYQNTRLILLKQMKLKLLSNNKLANDINTHKISSLAMHFNCVS